MLRFVRSQRRQHTEFRRRNAISCKTAMRWRNRIQIEMWLNVVCTLINNEYASLLFVQTFFLIVSACWASLPVFERKVWPEQVANLHSSARALSSPSRCFQLLTNLDKDFFHYLGYVVKKIVVDSLGCASWVDNILITVMTCTCCR